MCLDVEEKRTNLGASEFGQPHRTQPWDDVAGTGPLVCLPGGRLECRRCCLPEPMVHPGTNGYARIDTNRPATPLPRERDEQLECIDSFSPRAKALLDARPERITEVEGPSRQTTTDCLPVRRPPRGPASSARRPLAPCCICPCRAAGYWPSGT